MIEVKSCNLYLKIFSNNINYRNSEKPQIQEMSVYISFYQLQKIQWLQSHFLKIRILYFNNCIVCNFYNIIIKKIDIYCTYFPGLKSKNRRKCVDKSQKSTKLTYFLFS